MTLLELAERVEKATGPDRELELAIWRTLNPIHAKIADDRGHVPLEWLHAYTSSLDAAMTLIPEGQDYSLERVGGEDWASVDSNGERMPCVRGKTPALALTAACLRARASQEIDE